MYRKAILPALLILILCPLGQADDREDIDALVQEFSRLEAAQDVMTQAKLMTPDRLYVSGPGRRTNQALNMEIQQAGWDQFKKRFPNAKVFYDARDLIVRVYGGDAAIASFYWYGNIVLSPEAEGPDPQLSATIVTLFLVKEGGAWKIAASHNSLLNPSN